MNLKDNGSSYTDELVQNNDKDIQNDKVLDLKVTENVANIGIVEIVTYRHENENILRFDFNNKRKCYISFSPRKISFTNLIKEIKKKLLHTVGSIDDHKGFNSALIDIESQIVENRYKIFNIPDIDNNENNNNTHELDIPKTKFIEDVNKLRNQWTESSITYAQWQSNVAEKYENLRQIIEKHYPEAWIFMEFCLSVKSILNIQNFTLPFMGVLIAVPSSMKTMIIQLFRKYPNTFYTDSFTPSSLISHISTKTEQELQKVDMIPKMKNKVVLTPELAPIFTSKEDDLQKVLGITTRLLDGHGLENDSGAHGHRKYGNTMFVWLGAAVEIPPRVWKILGTLGHKIYFLRPTLRKKTIKDLIKIAKNNKFSENNKEIEDALLDLLKTFDAAPEIANKIKLEDRFVKVKWGESIEEEQAISIEYLSQLANLLAHLRGTVYVSESKATNYKNYNENNQQQQIDGQDYDTDFPVIEDPSRAVILLRNLAIGHAISQGRDYLNMKDVPIVIKVALSTAPLRRVKVLDLLLKSDNGEVTTSQITKSLLISQPIATRTMRELYALGMVFICAVGSYGNSELQIKLKPEFEWFRSQDFQKLKEEYLPMNEDDNENQIDSISEYDENIVNEDGTSDLSISTSSNKDILSFVDNNNQVCNNNKDDDGIESCDNKICHTLKQNLPSEGQEKNNYICDNQKVIEKDDDGNNISLSYKLNSQNQQLQQQDNSNTLITEEFDQNNDKFNSIIKTPTTITTDPTIQNNNTSSYPILFERVTVSHEPVCHTPPKPYLLINDNTDPTFNAALQELLCIIKLTNGSSISFNSTIESLCKNNEDIKNHLGDKLTARGNRNVRELQLQVIRHPNIEVIKHKPQLLIRWKEDNLANGGEAQ